MLTTEPQSNGSLITRNIPNYSIFPILPARVDLCYTDMTCWRKSCVHTGSHPFLLFLLLVHLAKCFLFPVFYGRKHVYGKHGSREVETRSFKPCPHLYECTLKKVHFYCILYGRTRLSNLTQTTNPDKSQFVAYLIVHFVDRKRRRGMLWPHLAKGMGRIVSKINNLVINMYVIYLFFLTYNN